MLRLLTLNERPVAPAAGKPRVTNVLSPRELDVLQLIATGKSNKEIARLLFISLNTVATHVRAIFQKTHSANRTEAAAYAFGHKLTTVAARTEHTAP